MTLRELIRGFPEFFYPQTWYLSEPFLDTPLPSGIHVMPTQVLDVPQVSAVATDLPSVARLTLLFIADPTNAVWSRYLWCAERDTQGQRIYVGTNGQGLEIHRHLHITSRWGIPTWT